MGKTSKPAVTVMVETWINLVSSKLAVIRHTLNRMPKSMKDTDTF
jgi:hypothetical protein